MRDRDTRTAILELSKNGHGPRAISRTLGVSRNTIRRVLRSGSAEVPSIERTELAEPHEEGIWCASTRSSQQVTWSFRTAP
jgi:DNA invertase Pin-like site-specific DNA recombinase